MKLRKAIFTEIPTIWVILQQAIEQRKQEGSQQWQNGYPNPKVIAEDISRGFAYVLEKDTSIIGYIAIIMDIEPAYQSIKGKWITNGPSAVLHRLAVADGYKRKRIATEVFLMAESIVIQSQKQSIKVDTNFDNFPVLRILEKLAYQYCGEVLMAGSPRMAFEKVFGKKEN